MTAPEEYSDQLALCATCGWQYPVHPSYWERYDRLHVKQGEDGLFETRPPRQGFAKCGICVMRHGL